MPEVLKELSIAGDQTSTIWDYRGETSPNGGRIELRACVHHIPVISNVTGRGDLDKLRQVLLDRRPPAGGLMVQFGTDAEGNVALFTRADRLCFQAKGANQVSCGIEHMHFAIGEDWSKKQLRAAAWIAQYLEREFDIPLQMADVEPAGSGVVKIARKGHTSHEQISHLAGFNDRTDPGSGFDYDYMFHAAKFFKANGHFVGA
jgi:N-acetylmuramoyl-L-alanine amidase